MSEPRDLHLRGALGTLRVEQYAGREHLVVPVIALMDGVIHAVNASTPERVTAATLAKAAASWNGRPLVLGHPTKNGRQCSANEPGIEATHHFGTIFNSRMSGPKLLMDAYVDPVRAERIGGAEFVRKLRAGEQIEVSVGAYVQTQPEEGTYNGRAYKGAWLETHGDHLAFLPGGRGACSIEMGCGAHRAAQMHLVTAEGFVALGGPGSGNHGHSGRPGQVGGSTGPSGRTTGRTEGFGKGEKLPPLRDRAEGNTDKLSVEDLGDVEDWASEFAVEQSSALDMWMLLDDKIKLREIVKAGGKVKTVSLNIEDEDKTERWKSGHTARFEKAGFELFGSEDNYDSHEMVFVKKAKTRGLASKDCSTCDGTGQIKNEKKQEDCPSCDGCGYIKAAAEGGEAAKEIEMKKAEAIKVLTSCPCSGFVAADTKELESFSEERLTAMAEAAEERKKKDEKYAADAKKAEDDLKAAQATVAELKAAAAKQPTEEEYLAKAPESIRTLVADKKAQDAKTKSDLVAQLKSASSVLTEEQLNAKTLDELKVLAQFAKIETPDYSGRPIPNRVAADANQFTPPDPYDASLKALRAAK